MWTCPTCAQHLEPTAPGAEHRACPGCGGVWFDRSTLELHLEGVMAAGRGGGGTGRGTASPGHTYRKCPKCTQPMTPRNWEQASGVIVDVCGRDGVWLDPGELVALEHWVHSPKRTRRRREGGELADQERRLESYGTDSSARSSIVEAGWVEAAGELLLGAIDLAVWWD